MNRTMAPRAREVDFDTYNNDRSTKKEKAELIKENKKWVYDMARECADYMNNGDTLYKDLKEALKE